MITTKPPPVGYWLITTKGDNMNDMDIWEQEEAEKQLAKIRQEDAAWSALPGSEKQRINEERAEYIERFEKSAELSEEE